MRLKKRLHAKSPLKISGSCIWCLLKRNYYLSEENLCCFRDYDIAYIGARSGKISIHTRILLLFRVFFNAKTNNCRFMSEKIRAARSNFVQSETISGCNTIYPSYYLLWEFLLLFFLCSSINVNINTRTTQKSLKNTLPVNSYSRFSVFTIQQHWRHIETRATSWKKSLKPFLKERIHLYAEKCMFSTSPVCAFHRNSVICAIFQI